LSIPTPKSSNNRRQSCLAGEAGGRAACVGWEAGGGEEFSYDVFDRRLARRPEGDVAASVVGEAKPVVTGSPSFLRVCFVRAMAPR
jgi:hypothetical protein